MTQQKYEQIHTGSGRIINHNHQSIPEKKSTSRSNAEVRNVTTLPKWPSKLTASSKAQYKEVGGFTLIVDTDGSKIIVQAPLSEVEVQITSNQTIFTRR